MWICAYISVYIVYAFVCVAHHYSYEHISEWTGDMLIFKFTRIHVRVCEYVCTHICEYSVCLCVCGGSPLLWANLWVEWWHVYIHIYMHTFACIWIWCIDICECVWVCVCLRMCVSVCGYGGSPHLWANLGVDWWLCFNFHFYTQVFVCMYICEYIYVCIYAYCVCLCVCGGSPHLRANLGSRLGTCLYSYIHANVFACIYICVYVCVCICISWEVGGWGRNPKKCTGGGWGMGSSTI